MRNDRAAGGNPALGPTSGKGGGGVGGGSTIQVDGTPGLFGDGSPGAKLSQHVADPTHNGYMSLTQAQLVAALALMDGWGLSMVTRMQTIVPAINRVKRLVPQGEVTWKGNLFNTVGGSSRIEGGGNQPIPAATNLYSGEPLTQGIKGNSYALGFEANFAPPTAGHVVFFGMANPDNSFNLINLVTDFDGSTLGARANLHTNLFLLLSGTGAGADIVIDTGIAVNNTSLKGVISSDGVTIKADINGVNVASQAVAGAGRIVDGPACMYFFATGSADLQVSDAYFGYVSPTPISP